MTDAAEIKTEPAEEPTSETTNPVAANAAPKCEPPKCAEPPSNTQDPDSSPEIKEAAMKLNNLYNQISGGFEKETSSVLMDHCYARPWNWRPESDFLRPTKTLFVSKPSINKRKSTNPLAPLQDVDDVLDVETVPPDNPPIYDEGRAKQLMEECEKHANLSRGEQENENWEETISRITWNPLQNRLFNGMVSILNADSLARLAYSGICNEPVLRRTIIEKSVKRMRRLLASAAWDPKITQWLHQILIENLSTGYLSAYLDMLQTLRSKMPSFVDKMMLSTHASGRLGALSYENLFGLLKKPWDPVASAILHEKPKKLPGNPVIVVVPTAPTAMNSVQNKRLHKWVNLLTNLAHVVHVSAYIGSASHRMTMMNCVDQMLASTRSKLQEVRAEFPGKNIILVGFNAGAALALQVAQVEHVLCVVCLGFSLLTAEGRRGDPDDNLLELQCPVLFVIGQCSNTSLQEDMEDLRERMRVETGLIVVGSADDYLRIGKKKKRAEGITQSVVDRFIVDEVGEFVSGILLSPCPPQLRQSPVHVATDASGVKRKIERKRYNSNGSSIDSEPPSPTIRMSRPGQSYFHGDLGRPPGSKSKAKLEAKWAAQVAQGTHRKSPSPCNSPPPLTPVTPDTSSTDSSTLTDRSMPSLITENTSKSPKSYSSNPQNFDRPKKSNPHSSAASKASTAAAASNPHGRKLTDRFLLTAGNTLSHLLQGNIKSATGAPSKQGTAGIKVLENVTLNAANSTKLVSSSGRSIDLSKITVLNSLGPVKGNSSSGNVLLMPDGKIKTISSSVKTQGTAKYITSKKQLLGNRPPKTIKKLSYVPANPIQTNLPPPANLTSQDIMDLPIVFADDNQILTRDNTIQPDLPPAPAPPPQPGPAFKIANPTSSGKFVFVNKQVPAAQAGASGSNIVLSQANIKKPPAAAPAKAPGNPIKFTKIILSKRPGSDEEKRTGPLVVSKISGLPSEITVKKLEPPPAAGEPIDLENELVATAVPNPNFGKGDVKNVTIITKKPDGSAEELAKPLHVIINEAIAKRTAALADIGEEPDPDDPDYIPPKNMKLDK